MPEPALAAGGLSLVGKALASISPNLVVASSAAVQIFSWLQLARIPISAVVASVAILMLIPMHYNVLYGVLTSTNTKDIDEYTSKGISGFPNKKISWFDKIKVRGGVDRDHFKESSKSSGLPSCYGGMPPWHESMVWCVVEKCMCVWREREREREVELDPSGRLP